jgi:hypothetical protein
LALRTMCRDPRHQTGFKEAFLTEARNQTRELLD